MQVKEERQLFQLALGKVETLIAIGVEYRLCKPQDLSKLKEEVNYLRTSQDLRDFKASASFVELSELMRSCGSICCKKVVKPNDLMMFFRCNSCPLLKFEETFLA